MSVAFSISGGGTLGAYQVGMIKALTEKGVVPDHLYGTSVGALACLAYATVGPKALEDQWLGIRKSSEWVRLNWRGLFLNGIYDLSPVRKTVTELLKNEIKIPFTVTYTDLKDFTLHWVDSSAPKDELIDAVVASCVQPFVMVPVNETWVDGGVRMQIPFCKAMKRFDKLYFLCAQPRDVKTKPDYKPTFPKILSLGSRTVSTMLTEMYRDDIKDVSKYTVLAPTIEVIGGLDFDPGKIKEAIKHGYELTKAVS